MLIIGDSYAAGKEADTGLTRGWPDILNVPQNLRQAIGGSKASEWAGNVGNCLAKAILTPDDMLVVSLLGNDVPSGICNPVQVIVGIENFHHVLVACASNRKRIFVFLYPDPFFGTNDETRIGTPLINRAIRIGCYGVSVEFVDLENILNKSCFNGVDIHPTRHGHEVIADYIKGIGAV